MQTLENAGFDRRKRFVVAVSGGADSLMLLDLMVKAKLNCIAAHFNHQIRLEAGQDAAFVQKVALEYGIPFFLGSADVLAFARQAHLSVEEAARKSRYPFLFQVAAEQNAQAVVVAHHANDQAETVLMHFLRGSGLDGLKGILPTALVPEFHASIPLFRPLLSVWREEIEAYCAENHIPYVTDQTNNDITYTRNKLRHELFPALEASHPGLQARLANMADILQADSDIIVQAVDQAWHTVCIQQWPELIWFDKKQFFAQPVGIQRRIVRRAILAIHPAGRNISFSTVVRSITNLNQHTRGEFDLVDQVSLILHDSVFYIGKKNTNWYGHLFPQLVSGLPIGIPAAGTYRIHANWQILLNVHKDNVFDFNRIDRNCALIDVHKAKGFPWMVRNWQPGDRFRPFGMRHGQMKLADLFINEKVLKPARKHWPVLVNAHGEIMWVAGLRADERFRIEEQSRCVMEVRLERLV